MEKSLSNKISDRESLTDQEQESLVRVFGAYCQERTKRRLAAVARWVPDIESYGIFNRVVFRNGECHYVTGQSYPDEIRVVRKLLLGN